MFQITDSTYYSDYRAQGLNPLLAYTWSKTRRFEAIHPIQPPVRHADRLNNRLRIIEVRDGVYIAACGYDGIGGRKVIPAYTASGKSARAAYKALDGQLRKRARAGKLTVTTAESYENIQTLHLIYGWE